MKNRKNRPVNGKVFRSGVYSTAILAAAILLAVLVNLVVRALPSKYTEFDLSEGKMYTLGDSSVQLAQSLQQDVTIYYLCETGSEDAIITKLLDHYAAESSHIHWDYSDYYTTGSANVTFGGEKQITAAIYKLTSGDARVAYYTTNHGEQALTSSLTEALNAQNITLQPLDLLTSEIPEDCSLLIINAPTSDLASDDGLVDEASMLQNYLNEGGKMLLTTNIYDETPNLDTLMAEFGLSREPGIVVEGDSGHSLYGYPYSLFPDYGTTEESAALNGVNKDTHVMLSVAQGLVLTETEDVTAEPLLNTSEQSYSKQDVNNAATTEKESGDTDGPFTLAAWACNDNTGAEVIWIGCPNVDNEQVYQSIPGNRTFLQGCAVSLAGDDSGLLIDTKALEAEPITVAASQATTLGLVLVFILPAAVLIAGAVVVLLRRRR